MERSSPTIMRSRRFDPVVLSSDRAVGKSGDIAISCTHLRHLWGCIGFVKHVKHNPSKEPRKLEKVLERCANDGALKPNAGVKKSEFMTYTVTPKNSGRPVVPVP